ncbi:MAG: hypothetical protein APF77_14935 [Clostridia bacterium BRH_c25]|nr:MAG: hypothetical protein APF77_14935 [Clostridia bacterium BRH_c25]
MNVLLVCAAGMSTSLLVMDMKKYAGEDAVIKAVAFSELEDVIKDFDVILVGPQLRYKLNVIKAITDAHKKPVNVIDSLAYGRMDGQKVLESAKALFK